MKVYVVFLANNFTYLNEIENIQGIFQEKSNALESLRRLESNLQRPHKAVPCDNGNGIFVKYTDELMPKWEEFVIREFTMNALNTDIDILS